MPRPMLAPLGLKLYGIHATCTPAIGDATLAPFVEAHFPANWVTNGPYAELQIRNAVASGANCIRFFAGGYAALDGRNTQAVIESNMRQLATVCNSLGVYFYPCWTTMIAQERPASQSTYTVSQTANAAVGVLRACKDVCKVVGYDVFQESDNNAFTSGYLATVMDAIRQQEPDVPLTCSITTTEFNQLTSTTVTPWVAAIAPEVDYFDFHCYNNFNSAQDNLNGFVSLFPDHEIFMGEVGAEVNETDSIRDIRFGRAFNVMSQPGNRWRGGLFWSGSDDHVLSAPFGRFGLWDDDGTPRNRYIQWLARYSGGSLAKSLSPYR